MWGDVYVFIKKYWFEIYIIISLDMIFFNVNFDDICVFYGK